MTRIPIVLLTIALAMPLAAQDSPSMEESWRPLFDGKSLSGWRANENRASFTIEDDAIVAHGERSHLFYEGAVEGADFRDFELRLEIMTSPGANSGVYFHTRFQDSGWPAAGYEAQVNNSHPDPRRTASLYAVADTDVAPAADDEWFTMTVTVRGRRITTAVYGKTIIDHLEPHDVQGDRRLSHGTFALQAHDPESVVRYRKIEVKPLTASEGKLSRAERVALDSSTDWWERMDYGSFLSATVGLDRGVRVAMKGITVSLDPEELASLTFDTELLSPAFAWAGGLRLSGVTYNGGHGGHPMTKGPLVYATPGVPGWSRAGSLEDPRALGHGPLPRDWARYRGLHRHGEQVVFAYTVGDGDVLEMPALERQGDDLVIARHVTATGFAERTLMVVAEAPGPRRWQLSESNSMRATAPYVAANPLEGEAGESDVFVITDRADDDWNALAMGAPSDRDRADSHISDDVRVTWVETFASPHPGAGATGGELPRVHDGESPQNADDTARNAWFDGDRARWIMDLGGAQELARIHSYSWHVSNRAPQRFVLWGATGETAPAADGDLAAAGWRRIAKADSVDLGQGGRHGVAIGAHSGSLGEHRFLLFDLRPVAGGQGVFSSEIDVYATGDETPPIRERASADRRGLHALVSGAPEGARLLTLDDDKVLALELPSGAPPASFCARVGRGDSGLVVGSEDEIDLEGLTGGGPSLWPDVLELEAKNARDDAPYVVDSIPIPFDNPWASYMRVGGFDFFSDGDRAAVCTWNGDVWIVSGIGGELSKVRWRRFATGLFETLGLCIVDDVVYTNGKDQITRLHDLDGDGEADFYECFNNDVLITENFHEFTFDLQTDVHGNFYFAKGAPVRPGGRGFDKILPHNGTVLELSADGQDLSVYSTGLRAPNGIGVSPEGQITAGDNEGTWVPHCKLHWLSRGSFQGVKDTSHQDPAPETYNLPLCWFPMWIDNSGGSQTWVTSDSWGPFEGHLLHLSYGQSSVYVAMKEEVDGQVQGGVFRLPVQLASGVMRGRFHSGNGQLYVAGLKGWQTNAVLTACLQRVRYTGRPVALPAALHVLPGAIEISFTCELDRELAEDLDSYAIEKWNYVWGPMYGSPEVSADHPDEDLEARSIVTEQSGVKVHDEVTVTRASLQADGRTVRLEIPDLAPVMQMHVKVDLESTDGTLIALDVLNTIHRIPGEAKESDE